MERIPNSYKGDVDCGEFVSFFSRSKCRELTAPFLRKKRLVEARASGKHQSSEKELFRFLLHSGKGLLKGVVRKSNGGCEDSASGNQVTQPIVTPFRHACSLKLADKESGPLLRAHRN